ncbi:hypothetical protein AVEN_21531-1, partial [Araneus ventricosus]
MDEYIVYLLTTKPRPFPVQQTAAPPTLLISYDNSSMGRQCNECNDTVRGLMTPTSERSPLCSMNLLFTFAFDPLSISFGTFTFAPR